MTLDFGALDELLDLPGVEFTWAGVPYRVEPPTAAVGLWCERIAAVVGPLRAATTDEEITAAAARIEQVPTLDDGLTLQERVLGATYARLVANGVNHVTIREIGAMVFTWIVAGDEAATRYLKAGGRPEAGSRAERRAASKRSRRTGKASKTRSRGSTSGTTSRRT